jgi:hypothetical protein
VSEKCGLRLEPIPVSFTGAVVLLFGAIVIVMVVVIAVVVAVGYGCERIEPYPALTLDLNERLEEADLHCSAGVGDCVGLDPDGFGGVTDPHVHPAWLREVGGRGVLKVEFGLG